MFSEPTPEHAETAKWVLSRGWQAKEATGALATRVDRRTRVGDRVADAVVRRLNPVEHAGRLFVRLPDGIPHRGALEFEKRGDNWELVAIGHALADEYRDIFGG
jgi:hypothetical protein